MKGTRLPDDWQPDANLLAWAKGRRPDLDMPDAIERFRDYWCAVSGAKATKIDWNATFRNWVRECRATPSAKPAWTPPQMPSPAAHLPAEPASRRLSDTEREANRRRLADMLGTLGR